MNNKNRIVELEREVKALRLENQMLKQLVPSGTEYQEAHKILEQYKTAISELKAMGEKYVMALREIQVLKMSYQTGMDRFMADMERDIKV